MLLGTEMHLRNSQENFLEYGHLQRK